jgi:hypothetical protein
MGMPGSRALVVVAVLAGPATADEMVMGERAKRSIDCAGQTVTITGSRHQLTLRGRCTHVVLTGERSTVRVESLGRLTVSGTGHRVEWEQGLDGKEPVIENQGLDSAVVRVAASSSPRAASSAPAARVEESGAGAAATVPAGAGAPAPPPDTHPGSITVRESDGEKLYNCAGGTATVEGSGNTLTLRNCPNLVVNGDRNTITLQFGARLIRVAGDQNRITWSAGEHGSAPTVEDVGSGNTVKRAGR